MNIRQARRLLKELALTYWPAAFWKYLALRHGDAELEPEVRLLPALCDRGLAALDVGAHLGVYSFFMRPHARATIAFEPIPRLAALLRRQFRRWPEVEIHQVALSDRSGRSTLRMPAGRPGRATIDAGNLLRDGLGVVEVELIEVALARLDDLDLPPIGFVKIDVEGHELDVLRGADALLARDLPALLIEIEERHRAGALQATIEYLRPLGYAASFLRAGALHPFGDFDPFFDQNPARQDRYVRNFLFLQREQEVRVRAFLCP